MKRTLLVITLACAMGLTAACQNGGHAEANDTLPGVEAMADTSRGQTLVIDVEKLTPPKRPLAMVPYTTALRNLVGELKPTPVLVSHTRQTCPLVESRHPFFAALQRAYADHRPVELSPDALWLLICQGFSQHVNRNAEQLRPMFVDFEGKRTLTVRQAIDIADPNAPWEEIFPQFTSQIAAYTGQELVDALTADFSTSTPASRTASQITVMSSMQHYFDYELEFCGIPQVILHGPPEDWQRVADRLQVLRRYDLDWWVDAMLPTVEKIKRAAEGEVDRAFWRGMFKEHDAEHSECGDPYTLADGWIVNFYPYNTHGRRLPGASIWDGAQNLPGELATVPLAVRNAAGGKDTLTLWAGFVGIAQDTTTLALRPEIGWFITCLP